MKYFTIISNSVRKRSVLYDHDTMIQRAGTAQKGFGWGGGGFDKK